MPQCLSDSVGSRQPSLALLEAGTVTARSRRQPSAVGEGSVAVPFIHQVLAAF